VPDSALGASANVFNLSLAGWLAQGGGGLQVSLVSEGLGTADDARPSDLTESETYEFWFNIGIKAISCLTNDIATVGMRPLLVSQYLPSSTPETIFSDALLSGFLDGFVDGCRQVGCVYISGETPQLKTKIVADRLDVAGAVFGVVPPGCEAISGRLLGPDKPIVFFASSGPHENGFTPLRAFAERLPDGYRTRLPDGTQLWRAMNAPSVLYSPLVQGLLKEGISPISMENISGHGWQKIMRSGRPLRYRIQEMLPVHPLFQFYADQMRIPLTELLTVFNCGVGFMVVVPDLPCAERAVAIASQHGVLAKVVGYTEVAESRQVEVVPLHCTLGSEGFILAK
jgi:phosphoribosylformylglycinamidine cyclo-ligase